MGRKNSQAGRRPLDYTEAQLNRKDARVRAKLREVFEPYDRPKAFSNPLSEYLSREALEELKSTYWKE